MKKTIAIDENLCEKAREYAKKTGRTFSGLVEVCLKKILETENEQF